MEPDSGAGRAHMLDVAERGHEACLLELVLDVEQQHVRVEFGEHVLQRETLGGHQLPDAIEGRREVFFEQPAEDLLHVGGHRRARAPVRGTLGTLGAGLEGARRREGRQGAPKALDERAR